MTNADKDGDVIGDEERQNDTDRRSRPRRIFDAVWRALILGLFVTATIGLPIFIAIFTYDIASSKNYEPYLAMLSSGLTIGMIVQLGIDYVKNLWKEFVGTILACLISEAEVFRHRLYSLLKPAGSLILFLFGSLVVASHVKETSDSPPPIVDQVKRALTEHEYTKERGCCLTG